MGRIALFSPNYTYNKYKRNVQVFFHLVLPFIKSNFWAHLGLNVVLGFIYIE